MDLVFSNKEKIVGMFVIIVAVLLISTVIMVGRGQDWFKTYYIYYTMFQESYNLQENAAVKLFKADIGEVKKITPVGNKVKIKLAILEEYASRIRKDSVATVESPTFIGSEYISITPGSPESPLIAEGGGIPSLEKKSLSDFLDEFEVEKTAKMVISAIQDLSEVAQTLRDPNGPLFTALNNTNKTLSHFENIVSDIQEGKGTVGAVLKSEQLLEYILSSLEHIKNILENINQASAKTPQTIDYVNENLATIKKIWDNVQNVLQEVEINIEKVKVILANMEEGSSDVPQITRTTKEGIQEIRDGVENIDKVFKSFQKNFLIRWNLPPEPKGRPVDAGLRQ